jgi:heptosyltransferase-2
MPEPGDLAAPPTVPRRHPPVAMAEGPILLACPRAIGDFVRSHSLVRALRAAYPERPIDVLTGVDAAMIAEFMADVRRAFGFHARHNRLDFRKRRELARRLLAEHYATGAILRRGLKAAIIPYLAGIPTRVAIGHPLVPLNNFQVPKKGPRDIDDMMEIARALGCDANPLPEPRLSVPADEVEAIRREPGRHGGEPVVAYLPGSAGDKRSWPLPSAAAFVGRCLQDGWRVWLIGGHADRPFADRLATQFPAVSNFTRTPLRESVVRLASATAVVAKDGGVLHIAAALGRPTIGLFGHTDPWAYAPINPQVRIMMGGGFTRTPNGPYGAPGEPFVRVPLAAITPEAVLAHLSGMAREAA